MTAHRELLSKVKNWNKKHNISITPDDFEVGEVADEQSMTGVYRKQKRIDSQMMFDAPAKRSERIHELNQRVADPILAQLVMEMWATFFECFRKDEHDFEEAEFVDYGHSVQNRLDKLPPGAQPDIVTLRQMMFLLIHMTSQQYQHRNQRLTDLIYRVNELEFKKESAELENSWHIDEIHRCMHMVSCRMRGEDVPLEEMDERKTPLHDVLMAFLKEHE